MLSSDVESARTSSTPLEGSGAPRLDHRRDRDALARVAPALDLVKDVSHGLRTPGFLYLTMIAGIVLAAGGSTRMGRPKMLLPAGSGTLLSAVVAPLLEAGLDRVVVVLGDRAEEVRRGARLPADPRILLVVCAYWSDGMASSLKRGLESCATPTRSLSRSGISQGSRRSASAGSRQPSRRDATSSFLSIGGFPRTRFCLGGPCFPSSRRCRGTSARARSSGDTRARQSRSRSGRCPTSTRRRTTGGSWRVRVDKGTTERDV